MSGSNTEKEDSFKGKKTKRIEKIKNRKQAEKKIAQGIMAIHQAVKKEVYDKQGIATCEFTPEEIKERGWDKYFPHGMSEGVVVHCYGPTWNRQCPPIQAIVKGKIKSLCQAAKTCSNLGQIDQVRSVDAIEQKIIENFQTTFNATPPSDLTYARLKKWIQDYTAITLHCLYLNKSKDKLPEKGFIQLLIEESKHQRTTNQDVITFDEATSVKRFSYDQVMSPTTASHERHINNPPANLGTTFEGRYAYSQDVENTDDSNYFKIIHSTPHHASLAPIDAVRNKADELDILIDTCNRIEEGAFYLATLQKQEQPDNEISVDWCYQLLTTNTLNRENQAEAYQYIAQAVNLMSDLILEQGEEKVHLHMSLMNAGINSLARFDHSEEQKNHNKKAYLHLAKAFQSLTIPSAFKKNKKVKPELEKKSLHEASVSQLRKKLMSLDESVGSQETNMAYRTCLQNIKKNAEKFNRLRIIYNAIKERERLSSPELKKAEYTRLLTKYHVSDRHHLIRKLNKIIDSHPEKKVRYLLNRYKEVSEKLNKKLSRILTGRELNEKEREKRLQEIRELLSTIRSAIQFKTGEEKEALYLSCLFLKAYIADLYYSEAYKNPETAALFNAYIAIYQYLIGMDGTIGCKSGNDRTYVIRVVIAALEGRDLDAVPLPPNYHENEEACEKLKKDLSHIALSNTTLWTTVYDTTTTPKVNSKNYSLFKQDSATIDPLYNLGSKFAAHKIKASQIEMTTSSKRCAQRIINSLKIDIPAGSREQVAGRHGQNGGRDPKAAIEAYGKSISSSQGWVEPIFLPFKEKGQKPGERGLTAVEQADVLLQRIQDLVHNHSVSQVGIPHSESEVKNGNNQAAVIHHLKKLLQDKYKHLYSAVVFLPITTSKRPGGKGKPKPNWVKHEVECITQEENNLIEQGGVLLQWYNQTCLPGEYAIGGSVARNVNAYIQYHLKKLANKYKPTPARQETVNALNKNPHQAIKLLREPIDQKEKLVNVLSKSLTHSHDFLANRLYRAGIDSNLIPKRLKSELAYAVTKKQTRELILKWINQMPPDHYIGKLSAKIPKEIKNPAESKLAYQELTLIKHYQSLLEKCPKQKAPFSGVAIGFIRALDKCETPSQLTEIINSVQSVYLALHGSRSELLPLLKALQYELTPYTTAKLRQSKPRHESHASINEPITFRHLMRNVLDSCNTLEDKIRVLDTFSHAANNDGVKEDIDTQLSTLKKNNYLPLNSPLRHFTQQQACLLLCYVANHEKYSDDHAVKYATYAAILAKRFLLCKTREELKRIRHEAQGMCAVIKANKGDINLLSTLERMPPAIDQRLREHYFPSEQDKPNMEAAWQLIMNKHEEEYKEAKQEELKLFNQINAKRTQQGIGTIPENCSTHSDLVGTYFYPTRKDKDIIILVGMCKLYHSTTTPYQPPLDVLIANCDLNNTDYTNHLVETIKMQLLAIVDMTQAYNSKTGQKLAPFFRPHIPNPIPLGYWRAYKEALTDLQAAKKIPQGTVIDFPNTEGVQKFFNDLNSKQVPIQGSPVSIEDIEGFPSGKVVFDKKKHLLVIDPAVQENDFSLSDDKLMGIATKSDVSCNLNMLCNQELYNPLRIYQVDVKNFSIRTAPFLEADTLNVGLTRETYRHATPLTLLMEKIPADNTQENNILRAVFADLLCHSKYLEDRKLGEALLLRLTPDYIEQTRRQNPDCYYAQLCLVNLILLGFDENDSLLDELKNFTKSTFSRWKQPPFSLYKTLTNLKNEISPHHTRQIEYLDWFIKKLPLAALPMQNGIDSVIAYIEGKQKDCDLNTKIRLSNILVILNQSKEAGSGEIDQTNIAKVHEAICYIETLPIKTSSLFFGHGNETRFLSTMLKEHKEPILSENESKPSMKTPLPSSSYGLLATIHRNLFETVQNQLQSVISREKRATISRIPSAWEYQYPTNEQVQEINCNAPYSEKPTAHINLEEEVSIRGIVGRDKKSKENLFNSLLNSSTQYSSDQKEILKDWYTNNRNNPHFTPKLFKPLMKTFTMESANSNYLPFSIKSSEQDWRIEDGKIVIFNEVIIDKIKDKQNMIYINNNSGHLTKAVDSKQSDPNPFIRITAKMTLDFSDTTTLIAKTTILNMTNYCWDINQSTVFNDKVMLVAKPNQDTDYLARRWHNSISIRSDY